MSLNLVSEQLLSANGLNHQDLFAILGQLTERRLDYGDLYFQSSYHESWVLEDSIIKDGSYNIDQGVGVRAVSGEKTGFAYADQISKLALEQSAQAARTIVRDSGNGKVQTLGAVEHRALYTSIDHVIQRVATSAADTHTFQFCRTTVRFVHEEYVAHPTPP